MAPVCFHNRYRPHKCSNFSSLVCRKADIRPLACSISGPVLVNSAYGPCGAPSRVCLQVWCGLCLLSPPPGEMPRGSSSRGARGGGGRNQGRDTRGKDSGGHTTKDVHGNRAEGKHGNRHGNSPSSDLVCKSKRIPKKRTLDEDSDDEDGEIRYLQKLKGAKVAPDPVNTGHKAYDFVDDALKKKELTKLSKNKSIPYEVDEDFRMSRSGRDGRKKLGDDNEFIEDEESEMEEKSGLKEADSPQDVKIETPGLTTRQRALQSRGRNGESFIEFPDGLPAAASRKQKEKLSDVEIQAKKAEAAQRRKMQVEKAEKEQQAEAMRKILGLDSEKKKEEKKLKERENREKQARLEECRKNCVRTVMGPTGTVITFPESMGLPNIFNSKPVSYPPPREMCAGPSCTNPYKYRDSKTLLPLCSLACYKAVQGCPPAQGSEADQGSSAAQGSEGGQGTDAAQESAGKQA